MQPNAFISMLVSKNFSPWIQRPIWMKYKTKWRLSSITSLTQFAHAMFHFEQKTSKVPPFRFPKGLRWTSNTTLSFPLRLRFFHKSSLRQEWFIGCPLPSFFTRSLLSGCWPAHLPGDQLVRWTQPQSYRWRDISSTLAVASNWTRTSRKASEKTSACGSGFGAYRWSRPQRSRPGGPPVEPVPAAWLRQACGWLEHEHFCSERPRTSFWFKRLKNGSRNWSRNIWMATSQPVEKAIEIRKYMKCPAF